MKSTIRAFPLRSPTLFLAFFAVPVLAQDDPKDAPGDAPKLAAPKTALETSEERAETPHEMLASALLGYRSQKELVVRATVTQRDPVKKEDQANPGIGMGGIQFVVHNGTLGGAAKPFLGEVEAWRDAEGTLVIVSRKSLPGISIYQSGKRTIQRFTTEGVAPETKYLRTELQSIMDGARLAKHALAAELTPNVNADTGEVVWLGKISKDVVRPVRILGDPRLAMILERMAPRVLRASIQLRISKEGKLVGVTLAVVRNDPHREMIQGGGMRRLIIRGAPGAPGAAGQPGKAGEVGRLLETNADSEKHEIEGKTTVYSIEIESRGASERAKAFKREMMRLTEERAGETK